LTQELLASYNPVFKVNPPLRSIEDIQALKAGLLDGTIDAIATDHAPHPRRDKEMSLDLAPPGMLGLETALGVVLAEGGCEIRDLVALMSWNPARIARIDGTHGLDVVAGANANLCVFDPELTWSVDPERLASKSINTPYVGRTLRGRVRHTIFKGTTTVIDGQAQR
jgi:dihydroorotase